MVGGFLGDFIKGPLKNDLPEEIEAGIRLHRQIDAKSDCHPAIGSLKSKLPSHWCRYLGIVSDLYCDHLISNQRLDLLPQPIQEFSDTCYSILGKSEHLFPDRAKMVFNRMHSGRWLERYADLQFTVGSLERIGMRLKFENPLSKSDELVRNNATLFDKYCPSLCAGMQEVVAEWHAEARS